MRIISSCLRAEWLAGIVVGIVATLLINAPILRPSVFLHERQMPDILVESSDELFYMSRIREVVDGFPSIGNPAMFERRFQRYPLGILMENLLALPMKLSTSITIKDVAMASDILLPFLLSTIYFFALRPMLPERQWRILAVATLFLGSNIFLWKRPISPQATAILPLLWLYFFARGEDRISLIARWGLIGLMLYSYPFHWTYCLASEGCWFFYGLWMTNDRRSMIRIYVLPLIIFAFMALPWVYIQVQWSHNLAYQETLARLGLIARRLPAGPLVQIKILGVLTLLFTLMRHRFDDRCCRFSSLLIAGLLVLWQPLLTGHEAEFGNHYERVILIALIPALYFALSAYLQDSKLVRRVLMSVLALFVFASTVQAVTSSITLFDSVASKSQERLELKKITTLLLSLPSHRVILTENSLTEPMMTYTSHTPFASYDAYMYIATDRELLDRARLYNVFAPQDPLTPRGVFGTKYENRRLATRTKCILHRFLSLKEYASCQAIDVPCEQCTELNAPWSRTSAETIQALRKAHVSYLLLSHIPEKFRAYLVPQATVGRYTLYRFR